MWLRLYVVCCFKQKSAYERCMSEWSSDVCSSGLTLGIVRAQGDFNAVIDIGPFGMVVQFFGLDGGARHETKRLIEVLEQKRLAYRIARVHRRPAFKQKQGRRSADQFELHLHEFSWVNPHTQQSTRTDGSPPIAAGSRRQLRRVHRRSFWSCCPAACICWRPPV